MRTASGAFPLARSEPRTDPQHEGVARRDFDRFVVARPAVQMAMQDHFVLLKVNYSPQNRNEALLS